MSKATGFRLDENILPNLKEIAKEQERSVNWLVNNVLKNFIEGEKIKKKKQSKQDMKQNRMHKDRPKPKRKQPKHRKNKS